jgi:hypothetical protein
MPPLHPLSHYTELNLPAADPRAVLPLDPEREEDIPGLFARVATQGDVLAAGDGGVFTGPRAFRYTGGQEPGVDAAINHAQGVLRLGRGRDAYLAITAGDSTEVVAHLFVLKLGTRPVQGPWGSNLRDRGEPTDADGIVRVIALDRQRWHAGGAGMLGDVLAVPLEGNGTSAVRFLNLTDPANPTALSLLERPGLPNAGAAALGRLADGRYLCLVWREQGKTAPVGRLDFHLAASADGVAGFGPATTVPFPDLRAALGRDPQYQAIALLHPALPPGAGTADTLLYLLGTENAAPDSPFGNGPNCVDLYALRVPAGFPAGGGAAPLPSVQHVASHELHAPRTYCNLDAAGGVYLDRAGASQRLHLYGAYHWRRNRTFRFAEFSGRPDPGVAITDIVDGWIELYEQRGFEGKRLTLHGDRNDPIPDYSRIYVQDGDFNEKVSSVRWQLPGGWVYRLYADPGFTGTHLDLKGTGTPDEIVDLGKRALRKHVSSSRFERRP